MTKQHFIQAAAIVAKHRGNQAERQLIADAFAQLFAEFNPRFNGQTFYTACGLK
jgi:hypothetical protein